MCMKSHSYTVCIVIKLFRSLRWWDEFMFFKYKKCAWAELENEFHTHILYIIFTDRHHREEKASKQAGIKRHTKLHFPWRKNDETEIHTCKYIFVKWEEKKIWKFRFLMFPHSLALSFVRSPEGTFCCSSSCFCFLCLPFFHACVYLMSYTTLLIFLITYTFCYLLFFFIINIIYIITLKKSEIAQTNGGSL